MVYLHARPSQRQHLILLAGLLLVVGCSTSAPKAESVPVAATIPSAIQMEEEESPDTMPDEWPMMAMSGVAIVDGVEIPAADFNKEISRLVRIAPHAPPHQVKVEIIRNLERAKKRDGMAVMVKELRAKSKIENPTATAVQDNPNFKPPTAPR
jgi:hypothetical protein